MTCLVLTIGAHAQFSGSGNGTEADPYRIYTDIHLAQMANFLNQEGVVFELMKDIDLTSYINENSPSQGWVPIGASSAPFMGILKGNGHTIKGLYINRATTNYVGLWGYTIGATIENMTVEASYILGAENVGTLVGYASGTTFTNITLKTNSENGVKAQKNVGGMVGVSLSSIYKQCKYTGNVNATGITSYAGGLIGCTYSGSLTDCNITSNVNGQDYCGGLAGYIEGTALKDISIRVKVNGKTSIGGAVGQIDGTSILNNVASIGDITGLANVSGIVGELTNNAIVTFASCSSRGKILNKGDYTGGIIGKSNGICINSMDDCSHFGDIKGKNYVGGLVGAILNMDATAPTLNSYQIRNGSSSTSTIYASYSDEMVTSGTTTKNLNNCTAIGNVVGLDYVGGLVGESLYATSYTCSYGYTYTRTSKPTSKMFLWKNGVYVSAKINDRYDNGTYYYDFPRAIYTKGVSTISLVNSYYSGNISAENYVGGLIGHKVSGDILNCYTFSTVNGQQYVGGIAGFIEGYSSTQHAVIKSSVANNASVTASTSNVGRIYGAAGENITIGALASAEGNRALTQTKVMLCGVAQDVVDNEQNGTSVGPSMLRLKANYVSWGWNFDDNWNILETECYPYKKYQAAPPVIESLLQSKETSITGKSVDGGTVYMFYKDRDAVSTECNGYNWEFSTEALQSGAQVQLYTDVEGLIPSYFTSASVKYPGSGTEADPYRIYTAEDLQGATNSGYYKLMNDIDLTAWINENSPITGWPAIGRNSTLATYIDGDGHKVTGLWTNTTEGYNGLFSNYSAGYIKNLEVEVASGKDVKGGDYTGVLIGRMANGQIINCKVNGDANGTAHVGGLAGYITNSTVSSCSYNGNVTTTANNAFAGGVSGLADNVETSACSVISSITTTGEDTYVGGLYGKTNDGSLSNSSAEVNINGSGNGNYAGGLVGMTNNVSVTTSMADANITTSGSNNFTGGLVGYMTSPITFCCATGTVTASGDDSYTGGLVGYAESSIANSYSTADVNGTLYSAGLVGYTLKTVDKCYASGDIIGVMYGGGLVGELDGVNAAVTNSVAANNKLELSAQSSWGCRVIGGFKNGCAEPNNSNYALSTMQVSLNNVPQKKTDDAIEGIAKDLSELQSAATFNGIGWDMEDTWTMGESGYPELKCFAAEPATPDFIGGDANNDGNITMSDVVSIISHIMGTTLDGFNADAADINGDTNVTLSDVVLLIDKLMGKTTAQAAPRRANVFLEAGELYAANYNADALTLGLSNATSMTAVQMDIVLPEGVEVENVGVSSKHIATWARLSSGKTRVIIYSPSNKNFDSNNIATIHFASNSVDKDMTIEAISECAANGKEFDLANLELGGATAIHNVYNENEPMDIVTLSGQSLGKRDVRSLSPGVYVVNGRKYIIK